MNALRSFQRADLPAQLHPKIIVTTGDCWRWPTSSATGYAFGKGGGPVHRWAYETLVGPIPDGLDLDHLCHTWDLTCPGRNVCPHRSCVNPAHLEPVTRAENLRRAAMRRTHCPSGHPYAGANLFYSAEGSRACRACKRAVDTARARANGYQPIRDDWATHCRNGHEYTPENLLIETTAKGGPSRRCRKCSAATARARRAARKAMAS